MRFPIRTACPEGGLPPGRIPCDLGAPVLLLHTLQAADAFEELLSTGRIVPDPARATAEFLDAYAWMYRQMAERLPTRSDGALWLWAKTGRRDLVDSCRLGRGKVLLTCRVPRERVLLSEFDDWHRVLNGSPNILALPGESDDAYSVRFNALFDDFFDRVASAGAGHDPVSAWPEDLRTEIEASWVSIFDPVNYRKVSCWQATVHELGAEDVIEAVRIQAKRCSETFADRKPVTGDLHGSASSREVKNANRHCTCSPARQRVRPSGHFPGVWLTRTRKQVPETLVIAVFMSDDHLGPGVGAGRCLGYTNHRGNQHAFGTSAMKIRVDADRGPRTGSDEARAVVSSALPADLLGGGRGGMNW